MSEKNTGEPGGITTLAPPEITPPSPRKPFGRPWQPGVSPNPGGRPKDPIAAMVRDAAKGGTEIVEFLISVVRDDVDGRVADKGGAVDKLEVDAKIAEDALARAREEGDVMASGPLERKASELRARAKMLRAKLARKRKIAVDVKTRVAAAVVLLERGWGKPIERVDLSVGNPDGSPLGSDGRPVETGPLANLNAGDLAAIGEVLDRAAKRDQVVDVSP